MQRVGLDWQALRVGRGAGDRKVGIIQGRAGIFLTRHTGIWRQQRRFRSGV